MNESSSTSNQDDNKNKRKLEHDQLVTEQADESNKSKKSRIRHRSKAPVSDTNINDSSLTNFASIKAWGDNSKLSKAGIFNLTLQTKSLH